ncbi:hypothetical protein PsYK624_102790 [Phanerochaete sordida]|uniref:Uncharacterized protein n=1 Tax=Phanerochaete sordida TaxID=48140 RepID=A0A9P3GG07_9APHY|nr:hypothetical protein PsYK624_102790 [Phanerochaete sordida]
MDWMYNNSYSIAQPTVDSWKEPYVGRYDEILYDTILSMKEEANGASFKNILPIIQSSGTGKSRLAHELAKLVVTIPVNIRSGKDRTAYPAPDIIAHSYFTTHFGDSRTLRARYLSFLIAAFLIAAEFIDELSPGKLFVDEQELAKEWREQLDADDRRTRDEFYDTVIEMARSLVASAGCEVDAERPDLDHDRKSWFILAKIQRCARLDGPQKLAGVIHSRLASGFKHPDVVALIYIDEVHSISNIRIDGYRAYDILLTAFNDLGPTEPIFMLTISTDPSVVRQGPTPMLHQPPYTELVFDQPLGDCYLFSPGTMTLEDVAHPYFMAKFGRPLFATRAKAARAKTLESVLDGTVEFAIVKLLCYGYLRSFFSKGPEEGYSAEVCLAPLCVRLNLDFDIAQRYAQELTEKMVERHMRIAYAFPGHNEYVKTAAPSEPLLAEAAAVFMNQCKRINWVQVLVAHTNSGLVKKSARGDVAARLLLTLAFDRAGDAQRGDEPGRYSAAVPVLDFLRALLAERWHDALLDSAPAGAPPLREAFRGAFVRFTHFVEHDDGAIVDVHVALAAVARGFAMHLGRAQAAVDIAVPVVMQDAVLGAEVMSYIFVQLKMEHEPVAALPRDAVDAVFDDVASAHPFIHLVMQLQPGGRAPGSDPGEAHPSHPCYRLAAYGCSPDVYGVIDKTQAERFASMARPRSSTADNTYFTPKRLAYAQRLRVGVNQGPTEQQLEEAERVEGVFVL